MRIGSFSSDYVAINGGEWICQGLVDERLFAGLWNAGLCVGSALQLSAGVR
jgi:hypothetical protein